MSERAWVDEAGVDREGSPGPAREEDQLGKEGKQTGKGAHIRLRTSAPPLPRRRSGKEEQRRKQNVEDLVQDETCEVEGTLVRADERLEDLVEDDAGALGIGRRFSMAGRRKWREETHRSPPA